MRGPVLRGLMAFALVTGGLSTLTPAAAHAATPKPQPSAPNRTALADPSKSLPKDWRTSADRAVTVEGDMNGLHVLVAEESSGYAWRTAATLADNSFDTDEWIGQACLTGSGDHAVVVYAPRAFTNNPQAMARGGFVAVVNVRTGAVTKVPVRASLAYYNPGCGAGETVAVSADDGTGPAVSTTVHFVDATTGKVTDSARVNGQVTSAVASGTGAVAVAGSRLVSVAPDGTVRTLATEKGTPFRLHADRSGGVAYEVATGRQTQVRRFAGGRSTLLGAGALGKVRLAGAAGNVYVLGADRTKVTTTGLSGWKALDAPVNAEVSTRGTLAVTGVTRLDAAAPKPDQAQRVRIAATVTAPKSTVTFDVKPAAGTTNDATAVPGPKAARTPSLAPGNDPTDPDRGCAVARNDPTKQAYQATASQVEWAADLAVQGALTITRPSNWYDSGLPSYRIQGQGGLFPLHQLAGGGHVPAQVLLGVLAQESNTMHASPHSVDGETGNFNQGGFYGDWSTWSSVDCGYGVGQVTTGMAVADGDSVFSATQQQAIATDYAANIAASVNMLIDKWNQLYALGIKANDGDPQYVENWYLAAWAYNTGLQPNAANGNTTGCSPSPTCTDGENLGHWGLGWSNNPANQVYPVDRDYFDGQNSYDTKHPNLWPYQEKVIGWAYKPVARYDYQAGSWAPAYRAATSLGPHLPVPDHSALCAPADNQCQPGGTTDVNGKSGAGLCMLNDLHCWWHLPLTWLPKGCADAGCAKSSPTYNPGDPEPARPNVYPANCSTASLPFGAKIIDDTSVPDPFRSCAANWTPGGSFGFTFAQSPPASDCARNCITYQSKIDFHQIGGSGFNGHFWFAHTVSPSQSNLQVTGTWTLDQTNAWTRLFVHIPQIGAQTRQAKYVINLPNGKQRFRVIPTSYEANTWVDLGVYDMTGPGHPTVQLSNVTQDGNGSQDIAWDAIAYETLSAKPANFVVALGDSYSSGEGTGDYYHVSDQYGDTPDLRNACRRSPHAWARQVTLPGMSRTIGELADSADPSVSFAFGACSGARTFNLASTQQPWNPYGGPGPQGQYGELPQLDQGLLDDNTTLVLMTIGGNDAGFASIATECAMTDCTDREDQIKADIANRAKPRVQEIMAEIRKLAPNALIVVASYPHLFNDDAALDNCSEITNPVCTLVKTNSLAITADEAAMLNRIADYLVANVLPGDLNNKILGVDTNSDFSGHAITAWSSSDYLNTVTAPNLVHNKSGEVTFDPSDPTKNFIGMGSFHPTARGAKNGYAAAVTDRLRQVLPARAQATP